ncbi:sterol 3-beta-glucosyltransferase UGT80A2 isoform X2 [Glycine max]|uniref:sterol 3-beta-glucosyltransferase UGT80A2 isoform X2 n=1 Tax=Glycine max TaxID=3847 RepID=UPI001B354FBD|nr:sterol 3-beta-glucosyltransferase UGT80A2 isoform X2 [Glycine max]
MERRKPKAVFMAFGTKGDVYPLAAIAAAFARDQKQYDVMLITHSAHESLSTHLAEKHVQYCPVSSPPVLCADQNNDTEGLNNQFGSNYENWTAIVRGEYIFLMGLLISGKAESSFFLQKKKVTRDLRQECYALIERIFGDGPGLDGDLIVINFFALEGWSLAESFCVRCIVAAPYVVPYSAPATFESQFQIELPLLYKYLIDAPSGKVCWKDVIHWMWPLFTENWGSWRNDVLHLSPCPFTDPVTGIPTWHDRPQSPLVMYGFSKEVVECPEYWPSKVLVCGFWFLPIEWQFTCKKCRKISLHDSSDDLCPSHLELQNFIKTTPIFIGLSSIGSMGFLKNPYAFICVLQTVLSTTNYRFILFTARYEPLESIVRTIAAEASFEQKKWSDDCVPLCNGRLLCFSGSVPYGWLFPKCAAVIHHGGSGTTAAALQAGTPQVVCPFILDQFYWAERMHWLGVSPEPLSRNHLLPDKNDNTSIHEAARVLSLAIHDALSSTVKARAAEIAERILLECSTTWWQCSGRLITKNAILQKDQYSTISRMTMW